MGVGVDEAGRDDAPGRVDGARGLHPRQVADGGDAVARDGDVGALARSTSAVDYRAAREEDVVLLGTAAIVPPPARPWSPGGR